MWILTARVCWTREIASTTIYRLRSRNLTLICTRMEEKEKTEHGNLSRVPIKRDSRMMYDSAQSHQVTVTCYLPKQALPIDTARLYWRSHRQSGDLVDRGGLPIHNMHFLPDSNINRWVASERVSGIVRRKERRKKRKRKRLLYINHDTLFKEINYDIIENRK